MGGFWGNKAQLVKPYVSRAVSLQGYAPPWKPHPFCSSPHGVAALGLAGLHLMGCCLPGNDPG